MPARNTIDRNRVRELLAKGLKQTQIAARLGCSINGLATALKQMRREAANG